MTKAYKTTISWANGEDEFEETVYIFAETRGEAKVYAAEVLEIPFTEARITRAPEKDHLGEEFHIRGVLDGYVQAHIDAVRKAERDEWLAEMARDRMLMGCMEGGYTR